MKLIFYCLLTVALFPACKKDRSGNGAKVDIYLVKSFTLVINTSGSLPVHEITNAVLSDTVLLANKDIKYYNQSQASFNTYSNIKSAVAGLGPNRAFAVTVDGQVVYYGKVHPGYLSSMTIGLATIDPIMSQNYELRIGFVDNPTVPQLDKRSDSRIIGAFRVSGRLK